MPFFLASSDCQESLVCQYITPTFTSVVTWHSPLCVYKFKFPSSYKDTIIIRLGPNPMRLTGDGVKHCTETGIMTPFIAEKSLYCTNSI